MSPRSTLEFGRVGGENRGGNQRALPATNHVLPSESEQCAEQRVLMMQDQPAAKQLAWAIVPLAVALAVGHTFTYWYVRSLKQYYELAFTTSAAMMALMTAGGSLVAVWVAFGSRPLPVRLALAIPGVAIANIAIIALPNGVIGFRFGVILVVIAVLPSMAARAAGWRIIRFTTASDSAKWQASEKPFQFSLRQMFSWMLAVAMVAGLMRLLIQPEDLRQGTGLTVNAAYDLAWGIVALAGVWAALGRRHPVRRSLAVVAMSPIVILLILGILGANIRAVGTLTMTIWATLDALLTVCGLLLFRPVGFRLVRYRPSVVSPTSL